MTDYMFIFLNASPKWNKEQALEYIKWILTKNFFADADELALWKRHLNNMLFISVVHCLSSVAFINENFKQNFMFVKLIKNAMSWSV